MKLMMIFFILFGSIYQSTFAYACDHVNKREELGHYTSLFAFEVISTGLGTHLIKGRYFDIPARNQHIIAVAAVRTWWTIPYMKRVSDIIRKVSQSSAEEYLKCAPELSGRIYKYMFEKVELQLKLEPKINDIYDREKSNVSGSGNLPKLDSGIIDIEDSNNVNSSLQYAFTCNLDLLVILINTIFQEYAFGDVINNDKKGIYELAHAIVELSERSKITEQMSRLYKRAVHKIIADAGDTLYELNGADLLSEKLFPVLMRLVKADPILITELSLMKENHARGSSSPMH